MSYDWVKVAEYQKTIAGATFTETVYIESDARKRGYGWVMFAQPGFDSTKWFNLFDCGKNEIKIKRVVLFDEATMKTEERNISRLQIMLGKQRNTIPPYENEFSKVVWKELCGR